MKGVELVNIFLRRQGLGLDSIRNVISNMQQDARIFRIDLNYRQPEHNVVFNWGCVDLHNYRFTDVVNSPRAIARVSSKDTFRKLLYVNNLTMPTMLLSNYSPEHEPWTHGYPVIVRPRNHLGGRNLNIYHNERELRGHRSFREGYISLYIPKTNEYRVFVAQGRVVYVIEKLVEDTSSIAWNVHQGGRFVNIRWGDWNLDVVKHALKAFDLSGLHFGSVDVIIKDGRPYVLEINTAPALTSEYWVSCVAKVFDHMIENGSEPIPRRTTISNWRELIHPAINEEAITSTTQTVSREVERVREIPRQIDWNITFNGEVSLRNAGILREHLVERILEGELSGTFNYVDTETYTETVEEEVEL